MNSTTTAPAPVQMRRVKVRDLRPGNVLASSGDVVVWSYSGLKVRKGHNNVRIVRNGITRDAEWNRNTMVAIALT